MILVEWLKGISLVKNLKVSEFYLKEAVAGTSQD